MGSRAKRMLGLSVVFTLVLFAGGAATLVVSEERAEAAFPGERNGLIAFHSVRDDFDEQIYVVNPDGSGVRRLPAPGFNLHPEWSPDGRRVAFRSSDSDIRYEGEIHLVNADGSGVANLTESPYVHENHPAWYPSGRRIAYAAAPVDPEDPYAPSGDFEIFSLPVDRSGNPTGPPLQLTNNDFDEYPTSVSPDGQRLAFMGDRDGDWEIYVMGANRREGPTNPAVNLTDNDDYDSVADFSPDGSRLAFGSTAGGDDPFTDVWVMDAEDGSGKRNLTRNTGDPRFSGGGSPAWSPTGAKIAFTRGGSIWRMSADGTREVRVTSRGGNSPSWQPIR